MPFIRASELVHALLRDTLLPAARGFAQSSQALCDAIHSGSQDASRSAWIRCMRAWETLAAVPVAALVERRSARIVDFWPTRPAQIRALLDGGPGLWSSPQAMQSLGASAKGLPALEWLLYRQAASPETRALTEALARQVLEESRILEGAYTNMHLSEWDEADAWSAYGEWFGQAAGSLDQLRLKKLKAQTRGKDSSIWVRGVSGQTRAAWRAHALGLQAFWTGPAASGAQASCTQASPAPGTLTQLLLSRGYVAEATRVAELSAAMLAALERATPEQSSSLRVAQQAMAQLHRYVTDIGSDLFDFSQGFTDADGD
nr:imelysin family protein [uncultured Rhodoferax sp.]